MEDFLDEMLPGTTDTLAAAPAFNATDMGHMLPSSTAALHSPSSSQSSLRPVAIRWSKKWSARELEKLASLHAKYGNSWKQIAKEGSRQWSGTAIKNIFYSAQRNSLTHGDDQKQFFQAYATAVHGHYDDPQARMAIWEAVRQRYGLTRQAPGEEDPMPSDKPVKRRAREQELQVLPVPAPAPAPPRGGAAKSQSQSQADDSTAAPQGARPAAVFHTAGPLGAAAHARSLPPHAAAAAARSAGDVAPTQGQAQVPRGGQSGARMEHPAPPLGAAPGGVGLLQQLLAAGLDPRALAALLGAGDPWAAAAPPGELPLRDSLANTEPEALRPQHQPVRWETGAQAPQELGRLMVGRDRCPDTLRGLVRGGAVLGGTAAPTATVIRGAVPAASSAASAPAGAASTGGSSRDAYGHTAVFGDGGGSRRHVETRVHADGPSSRTQAAASMATTQLPAAAPRPPPSPPRAGGSAGAGAGGGAAAAVPGGSGGGPLAGSKRRAPDDPPMEKPRAHLPLAAALKLQTQRILGITSATTASLGELPEPAAAGGRPRPCPGASPAPAAPPGLATVDAPAQPHAAAGRSQPQLQPQGARVVAPAPGAPMRAPPQQAPAPAPPPQARVLAGTVSGAPLQPQPQHQPQPQPQVAAGSALAGPGSGAGTHGAPPAGPEPPRVVPVGAGGAPRRAQDLGANDQLFMQVLAGLGAQGPSAMQLASAAQLAELARFVTPLGR